MSIMMALIGNRCMSWNGMEFGFGGFLFDLDCEYHAQALSLDATTVIGLGLDIQYNGLFLPIVRTTHKKIIIVIGQLLCVLQN